MIYLQDTGQFQLEVLSMQSETSKWSLRELGLNLVWDQPQRADS